MNTQSTPDQRLPMVINRLLTGLLLSVAVPVAVTGAISSASAAEVVASQPRQVLELGALTDASVIVNGQASDVILRPGVHAVNGDVSIAGSNSQVVVEFNGKKEYGQLEVSGKLTIGPEDRPLLNLNMGAARFAKGEQFVIVRAAEIVGEFAGLANADTLQSGDITLRIDYDVGSITLTVTDVPKHWHPRVTPVFEFDADVVNPTATSPVS